MKMLNLFVLVLVGWCVSSPLQAADLFVEDFEAGNLDQWVGPGGPNGQQHGGTLVLDPLDSSNTVLTFNRVWVAGDIFTLARIDLASVVSPVLTFDYLGLAKSGSVSGDLGGFLGIASEYILPGPGKDGVVAFWIFATRPYRELYGPEFQAQQLIDDGQWHSYSIDLAPYVLEKGLTNVYIMIEDFSGSGPVAGDAYFDNIRLVGELISETVGIDVYPGAAPNCSGAIPVAVLGSASLDISQIDPSSLSFEGLNIHLKGNGDFSCGIKDVNSDDYLDYVCQYDNDSTEGQLTGKLLDGTPIEGSDVFCVKN